MKVLKVDLAERSYPIMIGSGLLDDVEAFKQIIRHRNVIIVSNTTVSELYIKRLYKTLEQFCVVQQCILSDGEEFKTLDSFNAVMTSMLQNNMGRDSTVVALGGGVVGDISGFAASAYQRGVDFVQVPTTLLAQVDSSVGGKTGVNHPLGKNMIGAFYQPKGVIIDIDCLKTLPPRQLSAGMAEVIKYGIIWDKSLFANLEAKMAQLLALDKDSLTEVIARCCEIKADVVHQDEKEGGLRALLNLGHTFGHAIETFMGYGVWLHGEAVAAGTVLAAQVAQTKNLVTAEDIHRIVGLLKVANLPTSSPQNMTPDDYVTVMHHDKKVKQGHIRYVLPEGIGKAKVFADITDEQVKDVIRKHLNE